MNNCMYETYSAFGVNMTVTMSFFKLTVFESGSVSIDRLIGKRVSYLVRPFRKNYLYIVHPIVLYINISQQFSVKLHQFHICIHLI